MMRRKKSLRFVILSIVGIVIIMGIVSNGYAKAKSEVEIKVDKLIRQMRHGEGLWPGDILEKMGVPAVEPLIREYRHSFRESKSYSGGGKWRYNPKPGYRSRIIGILGKIGTDKTMKLLFEVATDKNEDLNVRGRAVRGLGSKRYSFTEESLVTLLKSEEKEIARNSLSGLAGLAKKNSAIAIAAIVDSVEDQRKIIRTRAFEILLKLDKPASTKKLLEILNDPYPDFSRPTIIFAFARRKTGPVVDGLALVLESETSHLSRLAAVALGENPLPGAAVVLRDIAADESKSLFVRKNAFEGLGAVTRAERRKEDEAVIDDIMNDVLDLMKKEDTPTQLRWAAIRALKDYLRPSRRVVPIRFVHALVGQMGDENRRMQKETFDLLAEIANKRNEQKPGLYPALESSSSMDKLTYALQKGESALKYDALTILMSICRKDPKGAQGAVDALIKHTVKNKNFQMTSLEAVMMALANVGTPEAVKGIIWAIDNKRAARAGCKALGKIGSTQSDTNRIVSALARALKDTDYRTRRAAVVALGKIGSDRVVRLLKQACDDTHNDVRRSAINALKKMTADY
ncbi:MAG: hypothetical protein GY940_47010 [bacterium]|nr:hypothetical protein [bacterium]